MWISVSDLIACLIIVGSMYSTYASNDPQILVGPTNITTFVESSMEMTCQAVGQKLRFRWQKRTSPTGRWETLTKSSRYSIQRSGTLHSTFSNGTLAFSRVLWSDHGFYRCVAENNRNSVDSASAYLDVQAKAHIVNGLKDVEVTWGTELTFECEVVGIPFPNRTWSRNGKLIIDARKGEPYDEPRLAINATETSVYRCTAQNRHIEGVTNVSSEAVVRVIDGQCIPYSGTICTKLPDGATVVVPASFVDPISKIEFRLSRFLEDVAGRSTKSCQEAAHAVMCRILFPECIGIGIKLRPKALCSETCVTLRDSLCTVQWWNEASSRRTADSNLFPNCSALPSIADKLSTCSFVDLSDLEPSHSVTLRSSVVISVFIIVGIALVLVVTAIVTVQVILTKYRRQRQSSPKNSSSALARNRHRTVSAQRSETYDIVIDVDQLPMNDAYDRATTTQAAIEPHSPKLSRLECNRNAIAYDKDLSMGAFGAVFVAMLTGSYESGTTVVVKTLRQDADEVARRDFMRAGELVAGLDHPNIIRIVGACLKSEPMCLIFEHMAGGELCDYLRENGPRHHIYRDKEVQLGLIVEHLSIARQIADAMVYFSSCGFVHRDLAARNCLVGGSPHQDSTVVKLSDFGLAVHLDGREFHRGADDEEIPVRWMPPEAIIESRFSPATDVWSFAVLVWEVFSFGAKPYDGLSSEEAAKRIVNRKVLERPLLTPSDVYDLMRLCWTEDPSKRPSFETIYLHLSNLEQGVLDGSYIL